MLIAAVAAAIVAGLLWQQQVWLRQHTLAADQSQARTLALAGVNWARAILRDDARTSSIDHLGEYWAIRLPTTPLENGEISGYIVDQQGLFNVNNLVQGSRQAPQQMEQYRRLLAGMHLPPGLADTAADWIDPDGEALPAGAEDSAYRALSPPTWPPNRPLLRVAELGAVRGYDSDTLNRLLPFLAALPSGGAKTPVNVNTAPPEVLAAVVENLSLEQATELTRQSRTFTSIADFRSRLPSNAVVVDSDIDFKSRFFLVNVTARIGSSRGFARALVQRDGSNWPAVVWQVIE
jgi:general secretion pathway protein K